MSVTLSITCAPYLASWRAKQALSGEVDGKLRIAECVRMWYTCYSKIMYLGISGNP